MMVIKKVKKTKHTHTQKIAQNTLKEISGQYQVKWHK
jgi:hypothetical protein